VRAVHGGGPTVQPAVQPAVRWRPAGSASIRRRSSVNGSSGGCGVCLAWFRGWVWG